MVDQKPGNRGGTTEATGQRENPVNQGSQGDGPSPFAAPSISLPKGGGAIRGMGEKFAANPVTGTGSMTIPIAVSPGRSGFGPQLSLSYDSGAGNGPFGLGWNLSLPAITRKTDKGLPKYQDANESDVFILSGAEDLVPVLKDNGTIDESPRDGFMVRRYRPRIEGLFARIERWTSSDGDTHWRSITKDNITTLYGSDDNSRLFDPDDPNPTHRTRIFSWLICTSYDDKGNAIIYEYLSENADGVDLSQVNERNRTRLANRHLKHIKYGNRTPNRGANWSPTDPHLLPEKDWMFEVVFDYGEHDPDDPKPGDAGHWLCRHDPFSSYRGGFELRTYRLCQRVLMFHHFSSEAGIGADCLVRSTDFVYRSLRNNDEDIKKGHPIASFIASVTQSGYKRQDGGGYIRRSLPPVEFTYSEAVIENQVRELDVESLENLPYGLDGSNYQWIDLDGDGVAGILTEQANAWFYKRNISPKPEKGVTHTIAKFAPVELVAVQPSFRGISGGGMQFLDLAGDGRPDLVQFDGPAPGFYEHDEDDTWTPHRPFTSLPNVNWRDPNLKFVDLTGDGHADILISEDDVFTWYPSLAEAGFGASERTHQPFDEEKGPRLVFADSTQSIFLADFSGDGLTDIVRIRNGEVCYWPNLGYGRFGAKVTMDGSPWFDRPDQFDQQRIRLADIDGSGATDIIYLHGDGIRLYFNQSGNSWSEAKHLNVFPQTDNLSSVAVVDLLGNGTACLVWSSPLPDHARRPMFYVDLMGGQKPHLMISSKNNLGAESRVHYAPSTKFYLEDKYAGKPWLTKLPFPVHVVERVETLDRISRNRFVTRYAYHHGYFDGVEREFRGFGMVEQLDTEEFAALKLSDSLPDATNIDAASHVPPVLTKTWFHTGAHFERGQLSKQFEHEYYREGDSSLGESLLTDEQLRAMLLPDTVLPGGLSAEEEREACRSLKGAVLRLEIYALDKKEESDRPYSVSESNYTIKRLQPRGDNQHAVFFTHAREAIDFHYERKLYDRAGQKRADPRVTHNAVLEVDDFGNVLKAVAIGYGRRFNDPDPMLTAADRAKQKATLLTLTENHYTNAVKEADAYRAPLPSESRSYELIKVVPDAIHPGITNLFRFQELADKVEAAGDGQHDLPYEDINGTGATANHPYRRLIEHVRSLYRRDDLTALLPLGELQSLALPGESYKLAFTPGLLLQVYGDRVTEAMLDSDGRYVHSQGDDNWWIPSGRIFFSPNATDTPSQELDAARQHFFLPRRFLDPFGNATTVSYDARDLLSTETRDALGNTVRSENDYRLMQPRLVTDPNGNRAEVAFDTLGMVVGSAVMGKTSENKGDSLTGFNADLSEPAILDHIQNPLTNPHSILQNATTRLVYDLFAYQRTQNDAQPQPAVVYTLARETHVADLTPGARTKIQHGFSYSDGFGREIQKKIQAEPGPIIDAGPVVNPRYVGSGWTVFNNKGQPVRQFEPFFSATHRFEFDVRIGVSPVLFYDPAGRAVATLHPNHTWEKVVFDPWRQESWDVSDTALIADPQADPDAGDFFARLADTEYLPTWFATRQAGALGPDEQAAAVKTAIHAGTPAVAHADSLGRTFLSVAHNKFRRKKSDGAVETVEERYPARVHLDIEGNQREVRDAIEQNGDAQGRIVMRYDYDMLGNRIHQASMEAGERWTFANIVGNLIYARDSRNHQFRTAYDPLQRPTNTFLREGAGPERLIGHTVYGESQPNPEVKNQRGKAVQLFDQSGVVTTEEYDFKGNALASSRQLAREYKATLDWSPEVPDVPLEAVVFTTTSRFDALNRPISVTAPDNSVYRPTFNEANLLEKVDVNLSGAQAATSFVSNIDYNAKGQRTLIEYGNGVRTNYEYDPLTFRLAHLQTQRGADRLQDLSYTYDPVGNITHIQDDAQQTIFFRNRRVEPHNDYLYDATYRLIEAQGREHLGQSGGLQNAPTAPDAFNGFHTRLEHPGDGNAMGVYSESYIYDAVGNFLSMQHRGSAPAQPGWTRSYFYDEPSLVETGKQSNRLSRTQLSGNLPLVEPYAYDSHGNMTAMPHLSLIQWDYSDQLQTTARQVVNEGTPETTWYVYDAGGQRIRKVTEHQATAGQTPVRMKERIYLGGFELYREYESNGETVKLERESLHVMDDQQRIALVETRTKGNDGSPAQLIRYQFGNHLGSASLELGGAGQIISYEEYYPYGSTSYQAVRSQTETPKRYRYTGMERDEETEFAYHGARYYAPWLGRWASCDPIGIEDGLNIYRYSQNNPIVFVDLNGQDSAPSDITWEQDHWSYTDEAGDIWNYVVHYGEQRVKEFESEWKTKGDIEFDPRSFWLFKRGEEKTHHGLRVVTRIQSAVLYEGWVKTTPEVIRIEDSKPKEEQGGLASKIWDASKSAAGLAFDLWSPTGKLKYAKWGIQLFQSYRESGSALQAVEDVTINVVTDKVVDKVLNKITKKNKGGGSGSRGGDTPPHPHGSSGVLVKNLGGKVPIPKETHFALGISPKDNPMLEKFARSRGAVSIFGAHDAKYFVASAAPKEFKHQFGELVNIFIKNDGRIKFNLTGMVGGAKHLGSTTSWELQQILRSDTWRAATDFFDEGIELTGEKLQRRIAPWR